MVLVRANNPDVDRWEGLTLLLGRTDGRVKNHKVTVNPPKGPQGRKAKEGNDKLTKNALTAGMAHSGAAAITFKTLDSAEH